MQELKPNFDKNCIPVIFSTDNNYIKYLEVTIISLIENSNKDFNYDIYILADDIEDTYANSILNLQKNNIKIQFVDIKPNLKNIDKSIFHVCSHFALPTYYRFFIPRIFKNFKKVLYLDCDIVILDDVAKLYNIDLNNKLLGAAREIGLFIFTQMGSNIINYFIDKLKLKKYSYYFQAGVLVMDIQKLLDFDFENKCINALKEVKNPKWVDQCILNKVLEGHTLEIPQEWNYNWQVRFTLRNYYKKYLPEDLKQSFLQAIKNPKIIHYASIVKPWNTGWHKGSSYFWKYAVKSKHFNILIKIKSLNFIKQLKQTYLLFKAM